MKGGNADEAKWIVLLLIASLIWGSTFVVVKDTLDSFGTFALLSIRFAMATAILGIYILLKGGRITRDEVKYGSLLGFLLFVGYSMQTLGLKYVSATDSAFITNLYVIMVPIFSALLLGRMPQRKIWLACVMALLGLVIMTGAAVGGFGLGEVITFVCAVGFALEMIYLSKYTQHCDPLNLSFIMIAAVTLLSAILVVPTGEVPSSYPLGALEAIVFLAVFATAIGQTIQNEVQKRLDPSKVAILLITEPIFAAIFGTILLGEVFTAQKFAGAALILLALFIAEYDGIKI